LIDTPPSVIYPLSLHDALPIWFKGQATAAAQSGSTSSFVILASRNLPVSDSDQDFLARRRALRRSMSARRRALPAGQRRQANRRSEEHTSELQSRENLVCRLLL